MGRSLLLFSAWGFVAFGILGLIYILITMTWKTYKISFKSKLSKTNTNYKETNNVVHGYTMQGDAKPHTYTDFRFASYYNDNMVLQAAPYPANVWGYSTKIGDTVTVTVKGKPPVTTTVKSVEGQGMWLARLPPVDAGNTPLTVTAKSSLGSIQLQNVLFGDVWFCSGQSNMQFTLDMVFNATEEMQDAKNYPNLRVFTVQLNESSKPLYDLLDIEEPWSVPNADKVGRKPWSYFSAVCWLYGKYLYDTLKKPIGLVASSWGGTVIETWSTEDSLSLCRNKSTTPVPIAKYRDRPVNDSVLWNAMIHPFLNMTIYGVLWYQGEENRNDPHLYNCTFPAMIDDWRVKFNEGSQGATSNEFPFGFVQLAARGNYPKMQTEFPDVRWSQTGGYGYVPNPRMKRVFMAVAMDLPDFKSPYKSIHPRDKQTVCKRLVKSGLSVAYNKTGIVFQGPRPNKYTHNTQAKFIDVDYSSYGQNIEVRSHHGFEICCSNTKDTCLDPNHIWIPTLIHNHTTHSVTVIWTEPCKELFAIRYAWRESPCPFKQCAIYGGKSQLPAPQLLAFL